MIVTAMWPSRVGPITLDKSAIGLAILSGVGAAARQKGQHELDRWGFFFDGKSAAVFEPVVYAQSSSNALENGSE